MLLIVGLKCNYYFNIPGILLAKEAQAVSGPKLLDFKSVLSNDKFKEKIQNLKNQVENFAKNFFMPGFTDQ